jgi:thioredoxin reductase (NADPH)
MSHPDFDDVRDITVIGAGPVGLSAAFWAGMREASSRIIDSLPELGGQLTTLYPEKWIFDVPGHPKILAKDLVELHRQQTIEQFDVPVHLETTADSISWEDDLVVLHTDRGDSACDWVVNLLDTAERVSLVHRREGFRAHEATVKEVMDAHAEGRIDVHVPYQVRDVVGNGVVEGVELFHSEDPDSVVEVPCDAILLQLGFKTALGPLKEWGFEIEKGAIRVDGLFKTSLDRVWACGDITTFDGKLKLIATGYAEAAIAVSQAVHHIRPEMKIQPKYSTNTGVPGAVEGQA